MEGQSKLQCTLPQFYLSQLSSVDSGELKSVRESVGNWSRGDSTGTSTSSTVKSIAGPSIGPAMGPPPSIGPAMGPPRVGYTQIDSN